jgi:hypothetical protein
VKIAREQEQEVEPKAVTESLKSHDKMLMKESCFYGLAMRVDSSPGEDAICIVKLTTEDVDCYLNSIEKAVVGFDSLDTTFERSSTVGKMLSTNTEYYGEIFGKEKIQSTWQISLLHYFKKLSQPPQPLADTTLTSAAITI